MRMPSHMEIYNPLYPKQIGKFTMYHSLSRAIHMTENGILSCFVFQMIPERSGSFHYLPDCGIRCIYAYGCTGN